MSVAETTFGRASLIKRWLLLIGVSLAMLGAKWDLIAQFGSDVPFGDQWHGELGALYQPWVQHEWKVSQLFAAHNEHRILWTRLLDLALLELNGQWDPLLQTATQALLAVAFAAALVGVTVRRLDPFSASLVGAATVLLLGSPSLWENTLNGFQSQFYFLLLFSVLHVGWGATSLAWSWRWWVAHAAGAAALFSMAPAFLGPAALLAWLAWRRFRLRAPGDGEVATAAINALLFVLGILVMGPLGGQGTDRPADLAGLLQAWLHVMSWPAAQWQLGLPAWAPLFLFLGWQIARPKRDGEHGPLLALALLAILFVTAIAYARGGVASRYGDIFGLGLIVNFLCLLALPATGRMTIVKTVFATLWIAGLGVALWRQQGLSQAITLSQEHARQQRYISLLREDLSQGGFQSLRQSGYFYDSEAHLIATAFAEPRVQAILPLSLRAALPMRPAADDVAPNLPDLPSRTATWLASPDHDFQSEPMSSTQPILVVYVAGILNPPASSMELVLANGTKKPPLQASFNASARWRRVNFMNPGGEFRLVVRADAPLHFSAPFEQGRWSWLCAKALGLAHGFSIAGWLVLGGLLLQGGIDWLRTKPAG